MANHPSALKQQRRNEKKRLINRANRTKMKSKIKQLRKKAAAGQQEEIQKLYPQVVATIDKTIRKGTIHKNTGARYKSRLSALVRKAGTKT